MFSISLSNQAEKQLKRLEKTNLNRACKVIDKLPTNPFLGIRLQGQFQGYYKIKIPPLRIIYSVDLKNKAIVIIAIGYRGDIYKKASR